jgi:signal transduction histidine kinase
MKGLISDLLDVAKIEDKTFSVHLSRCDVSEVVSDVVAALGLLAQERSIDLRYATTDLCVMGDRDRLHQVLSNLVSNAIKVTPSAGCIHIEARPLDGEVQFSVCDTGPGIADADQPRLFDRYHQPVESKKHGSGVGLGLYIARGIIEAHGGRIWVESAVGHGSTFSFAIPRA